MTTKSKAKPADAAKPIIPKPQTVLTIGAGQIGPYGYVSGLLVSDVPSEVIDANADWMTADADAVKSAKIAGADVVPYRG